jgi:hypothetical protein
MHRLPQFVLPWLLVAVTSGCAATGDPPPPRDDSPDLVACSDPRPQMCTMQYDPVCARLGSGDTAAWKSYSNGCTACSNPAVSAYRPGGACR